ncbi:BolA family protein [Pelagibaculum spongiae]|uniref:Cell division protein BolA n=1 Tax=Pelagibaculum spongiae TaxID=2080658 RepID=A0A2V1H659_9GAMM|nr:BolA/IbaG family iron-sulfur metabolism protein [Pelagibaculum spongiae]PVZ71912.1 cell division protein BolA [Pelagibaculum spongiae]
MDTNQVKQLLEADLPDCSFEVKSEHVAGDGGHYEIHAVGECFGELSRVKAQQLVMRCIAKQIASNEIHAVHIRTYTQQQWNSYQGNQS